MPNDFIRWAVLGPIKPNTERPSRSFRPDEDYIPLITHIAPEPPGAPRAPGGPARWLWKIGAAILLYMIFYMIPDASGYFHEENRTQVEDLITALILAMVFFLGSFLGYFDRKNDESNGQWAKNAKTGAKIFFTATLASRIMYGASTAAARKVYRDVTRD